MDIPRIRADFPALAAHPDIAYLDSACTALKPKPVIEAVSAYYADHPACAGRSNHRLSRAVDEKLQAAREGIAAFVKAPPDSLLFCRNTTEGLNWVANGLDFSKRRGVVLSNMEHHSLLLPFLRLQREGRIELRIVKADARGLLSAEAFAQAIDSSVALVATHHTSNVTGASPPLPAIAKLARDAGARTLIDAAQGAAHHPLDFARSGFDYLAFSGHKMGGPTGIGALVGTPEALGALRPTHIGGETIRTATLEGYEPLPPPKRFEAGIQHYSGIIGLGAACGYLKRAGLDSIARHELTLAARLERAVQSAGGTLYGPPVAQKSSGIVAFNLPGLPHHQVSVMMDKLSGVALRSGYFCAQPACEHLGAKAGAVRASLYLYNDASDIARFEEALGKVKQLV